MWYNSQGALQRGEAALVGHVWKAVKVGDLESHFRHLDMGFLIRLTLHVYALCEPKAEAEETWGRCLGGRCTHVFKTWSPKHPTWRHRAGAARDRLGFLKPLFLQVSFTFEFVIRAKESQMHAQLQVGLMITDGDTVPGSQSSPSTPPLVIFLINVTHTNHWECWTLLVLCSANCSWHFPWLHDTHPLPRSGSGPGQQQLQYIWHPILQPQPLGLGLPTQEFPISLVLQPLGNLQILNPQPAICSLAHLTTLLVQMTFHSPALSSPLRSHPPSLTKVLPMMDLTLLHRGLWAAGIPGSNHATETTGFTLNSWSHPANRHSVLTGKLLFFLNWFAFQFPKATIS